VARFGTLQAALAEGPLAGFARGAATIADVPVTPRAADGAVAAERILAAVTDAVAVPGHDVTAVLTGHAIPAAQFDIGAAGVVGFQDLANEREEIEQTPFGQGAANGGFALARVKTAESNAPVGTTPYEYSGKMM
jgi:hypothetical protein